MAKGIGLIGNFKGKVGNMVGYKLSDSNTGNTQGIRVYQPIVRNPKTSAQAEQRAKLAPINATYRALKMVIDRGNESLPYGNKSRLAWLKNAFKAEAMPWFEKGAVVNYPVGCELTKGSLGGVQYQVTENVIKVTCDGVTEGQTITTVGALSTALMASYPSLRTGDQITFVSVGNENGVLDVQVESFIIDPASVVETNRFLSHTDRINFRMTMPTMAGAVIISREGANGEHLRSNTSLSIVTSALSNPPYDTTSKADAIESYMSAAGANSDWAEESIQ